MNVKSGATYYALIYGGPSGRVGTLTLGLRLPDNTVVIPSTTVDIVETSAGSYTGTRVAPVVIVDTVYLIYWNDPGLNVTITEELNVSASGVFQTGTGLHYASPEDLRNYLGITAEQLSDLELVRQVRLAQDDIDAAAGSWSPYADTGLKFATLAVGAAVLTPGQRLLLTKATCAQAEYRMTVGEDFMVREQHEAVSGPGYSTSGKLRKVCGPAYTALSSAGLLRLTSRVSNRGSTLGGDLPSASNPDAI